MQSADPNSINWLLVGGEALKLAAQFAGAMIISWFTVRWALGRFKTEKMWERRIAALTDIMLALRELSEVTHLLMTEEIEGPPYNTMYRNKLMERKSAAKLKIISVSAVASVVLPESFQHVLTEIEPSLFVEYENDEPYIDYIERLAVSVTTAQARLLKSAKAAIES